MLSVGVLAAAVLMPTPMPDGLEAAVSPDAVAVSRQTFTDERTVEVTFETSLEQSLIGRVSGTVSESLCAPGQAVESGNRLLSVEGKTVIALHTDTPLYREIGAGDTGADVLALQQELARLGYSAEGNGTYGWRTVNGVNQLLEHAGRQKPDGRIGPTDVVWLPDISVTPVQCSAGLNSTLTDSAEIMKVGGQLTAVTFPVSSGLREGKRVFALFGVTISLDLTDGRITDQAFLDQVAASDGYKATLADEGGKKPTAKLALEQPIDAIKVPPSAITGLNGNHACISPDGKQAIPVTIIGSALGATLIQPDKATREVDKVVLGHRLDNIQCPADATK